VRVQKIATEVLVERLADWGVDTVFGDKLDRLNKG
jgi:thiamine pyrophosphate-dependent acetolactate synthase large subunit-like protein